MKSVQPRQPTDALPAERQMSRMTRRGFAVGALGAAMGLGGLAWLGTREPEGELSWPLRRALEFNERVATACFSETRLAPTFDRELAKEPKVNGRIGLQSDIDLNAWKMRIVNLPGDRAPRRELPLAAVLDLPRVEMVTELKCVEGWSEVVHWAGARFSDFIARYGSKSAYVGLATPDDEYAVGLDFASAAHPQTLLCYEMNGQPLSLAHGAPLRLVTTVKYGFKSLKRIGSIVFSDERPDDYWAARGYDWYAGH
jgi:DMSO/TMAO reductase YedYZ molybdopterin-dependent catalytic subunit